MEGTVPRNAGLRTNFLRRLAMDTGEGTTTRRRSTTRTPPATYDFAALEPHIDAQTMQIHHGKHHQAYITNLNKR